VFKPLWAWWGGEEKVDSNSIEIDKDKTVQVNDSSPESDCRKREVVSAERLVCPI